MGGKFRTRSLPAIGLLMGDGWECLAGWVGCLCRLPRKSDGGSQWLAFLLRHQRDRGGGKPVVGEAAARLGKWETMVAI